MQKSNQLSVEICFFWSKIEKKFNNGQKT